MRYTPNWTEYELLDTADGQRLERWGEYFLVRPDPQVIWSTAPVGASDPARPSHSTHPSLRATLVGRPYKEWQNPHATYERSSTGGGQWVNVSPDLPDEWIVRYAPLDLAFYIRPTSFKHTGLFPEQAVNWDWMSEQIRSRRGEQCSPVNSLRHAVRATPLEEGGKTTPSASPPPLHRGEFTPSVLNLFAYTGGATIAAAAAGAHVTHVDASRGMVEVAKQNAALNRLPNDRIRWIVDDCRKFVQREIRRGKKYDAIIMDPPSYGRGSNGAVWKLEDDIFPLIADCVQLLSDDALFMMVNSYTTGLSGGTMGYMLHSLIPHGRVECDEIGLPVTSTGGVLPCGSTAVWVGEAT